jgi:sugar phosphate isomerase/epimerase
MPGKKKIAVPFQAGIAISPRTTAFGPLLYSGDIRKGLQVIGEQGFTHVELSLRSVNDVDCRELKDQLQIYNLEIAGIATGQACLFDSLCLSNQDDQLRKQAVEHIKKLLEFGRSIDCPNVIIGGIRGRLTGSKKEQQYQYDAGVDSIASCAEWAGRQNMTLLLEPINRYEMNWVLSAQDGLDLIDRVGMNSLKLLLDTFHMNIEERDTLDAFRSAGDHLGYVHIADNIRQYPGSGQIDFGSILSVLKEIKYEGPVVAEILPLPDDLTAVQKTAEFWHNFE